MPSPLIIVLVIVLIFAYMVYVNHLGVSVNELQDLLSLCDDALDEVFQYSKPSKYRRMPLNVVLRLRKAFDYLLAERSGGCLTWYHRQLRETAERMYTAAEVQSFHSKMGIYFSDAVPEHIRTQRQISRQPLATNSVSVWLTGSVLNERRCVEGLYHLIRGAHRLDLSLVISEACSVEVIWATIRLGYGFDLMENLNRMEKSSQIIEYSIVNHFIRWLRQDMSAIVKTKSNFFSSACSQPTCSEVHLRMTALLCDEIEWSKTSFLQPDLSSVWIRNKILGAPPSEFQPLLSSYNEDLPVDAICISADGFTVASLISFDGKVNIWDTKTGACVLTISGGGLYGEICSMCMATADGSKLITGTSKGMLVIWDLLSGESLGVFIGHQAEVKFVSVTSDCLKIVSASADATLKIWHALSGECLHTKSFSSDLLALCIGTDNSTVVVGLRSSIIHILSLSDTNFEREIISRDTEYELTSSICLTSESHLSSRKIISLTSDGTIQIWNLSTGILLETLEGHGAMCLC